MFGDFSRFENDPEIGLNGIYLSQGSPILDSDWNEQVAALTDWITAVGQLSTDDKLKKIGFDVKPDGDNFEVKPGMAILGGRVVQSQSLCKATWNKETNKYTGTRVFSQPSLKSKRANVYLSLVSRSLPGDHVWKSRVCSTGSVADLTDWAIYVSDLAETPNPRTIGDGSFWVPRLKWQNNSPPLSVPSWATTCVIEFHAREDVSGSTQLKYKIAHSPSNVVPLTVEQSQSLKKDSKLTVSRNISVLLDMTDESILFAEYEDDRSAHDRSFKTLWPEVVTPILNDVSKLVPVKVDKTGISISLTLMEDIPTHDQNDRESLRPCLRLWNRWDVGSKDLPKSGLGGSDIVDVKDLIDETYLIAGDRWYLPVDKEIPLPIQVKGLPGHRVFRGIATLNNGNRVHAAAANAADSAHVATLGAVPSNDPNGLFASPPPQIRFIDRDANNSIQPVAHRLDDSLHRLTGALNAARALTRQTACKELKTRVSYLPLRRWLAATYVHEIVDLDLEAFLGKVRRSVDVYPEDEHRFREQAAQVLEEANQLAGQIPSRSQPNIRPQDIV